MGNAVLKILLVLCALATAAASASAAAQTPKPPAEAMGRLFFTPAQREQLDVARIRRARATLATERTEETQAAPTPQTITYDGVVRRSDGKSTVFLNSRPVNERDAASGPVIVGRVRADGGVSLQIPQSGRAVTLKPGQSIELLSGTIEERYSRKPAAPEPKPATKPATEAKPAISGAAEPAVANRDKDEQQRKVDEAIKAIQEAAAREAASKAPPPPTSPEASSR